MHDSQYSLANGTTTISTDYLRLITDIFERSLAAGQAMPRQWTESLQREHQNIMLKIQDSMGLSNNDEMSTHLTYQSQDISKTENSHIYASRDQSHFDGTAYAQSNQERHPVSEDSMAMSRAEPSISWFPEDLDIILVERKPISGVPKHSMADNSRQIESPEDFTLHPSHVNNFNPQPFKIVQPKVNQSPEDRMQLTCSTSSRDTDVRKVTEDTLMTTSDISKTLTDVATLLRQCPESLCLDSCTAQSLLNNLQTVLDYPDLEESSRDIVFSALLKLSKKSNVYPSNFSLTHVTLEEQRPIAHGSFGAIYKGRYHDRYVCLKVVRSYKASETARLNKAFSREAIIWRQLSHVNVLPFYGIHDLGDTRIALVSPWIEHGNINHFLRSNPDADRLPLVSDVANGLSYLHQSHVIHGDLKGANILVTDSQRACLADFGLSSFTDVRGLTSSASAQGGTVRWQAPELMDPQLESPKSRASDIYAFALACYEIFTGDIPFPEVVNDFIVMLKVVRGERPFRPPRAPGLSDETWRLMKDCWTHDPKYRPTMNEVVERLATINDKNHKTVLHHTLNWYSPSTNKYHERHGPSNNETIQALEHIMENISSLGVTMMYRESNTVDAGGGGQSSRDGRAHVPERETNYIMYTETSEATEEGSPLGRDDTATNDGVLMAGSGQSVEHADIITRLMKIFESIDQYRTVLNCHRSKAQSQGLLDLFQKLLDSPTLETKFRHNLIIATQRLAKVADLYPKCFSLDDVALIEDNPVAAGSFADIHKGRFKDTHVCFKVIRLYQASRVDYVIKRFYQEAILWGQLSHPNLLPFYGLYRFRSRLCLVSPWAANGDINNYLEQNPLVNRVLLALDIAAGIAYLHANGIIHGDLKGSNILVTNSGRACLADFGLSAVTDPKILKWTSQSSAASKGGSIRWQAPELFGAEEDEIVPNSKGSDVYAWACVCYEIFTGDVPFFEFGRDSTVMLKVGLGKRPSRPAATSLSWSKWGLTEAIWSLMQECWRVNPLERPFADAIVAKLSLAVTADKRLTKSWGDLSPSQFQNAVGGHSGYPSADALEAMLWGTTTNYGSSSYYLPRLPSGVLKDQSSCLKVVVNEPLAIVTALLYFDRHRLLSFDKVIEKRLRSTSDLHSRSILMEALTRSLDGNISLSEIFGIWYTQTIPGRMREPVYPRAIAEHDEDAKQAVVITSCDGPVTRQYHFVFLILSEITIQWSSRITRKVARTADLNHINEDDEVNNTEATTPLNHTITPEPMDTINDELMIDVTGTSLPQTNSAPVFPPLAANADKTTLKSETRRIPIPPHRMTPLKKDWINIFGPLTEILGLQVRMNVQRRCVEARTSKHTKDIGALQKGADFVKAYALGFDVNDAIALLRLDDLYLDSFEIKDVKTLHGDHLSRAIGRIAGQDGKTKFTIENASRTRIVLADTKIHIMGSFQNIKIARDAIVSLILGSPPGKVYAGLRTVSSRMKQRAL